MADTESEFGDQVDGLTILDALAQLKEDIYQLQQSNVDKQREPMFRIADGELELKLVAKRHVSGDGKVKGKWKLFVFGGEAEAGASAGWEKERLQTLRIRFTALGAEQGPRPQLVSATAQPITFGSSPGSPGPVIQAPPSVLTGGAGNTIG